MVPDPSIEFKSLNKILGLVQRGTLSRAGPRSDQAAIPIANRPLDALEMHRNTNTEAGEGGFQSSAFRFVPCIYFLPHQRPKVEKGRSASIDSIPKFRAQTTRCRSEPCLKHH
jgi:hypothetical protein